MAALALLASLSAYLLTAGQPDIAPYSQPSRPIRLLSSSHEVRFPDEVVFRLEAEAHSPITEVTLFYSVGGQRVKRYGYPSFAPGARVATDFSLKTGGASYLPSGVDIEFYYEIGDTAGNTLSTEPASLEYRDPRYDWQELRHGSLVMVWHDLPAGRVMDVAAEVDRRLDDVKRVVGLQESSSIKAVVVNSRREADIVFPFLSEAARRGHLYGGFAMREFDLFILAGLSADGMVHEAAHLLLNQALASRLARVPAWLNEGLAMYFETGSHGRAATLARGARRGRLMGLGAMNTVPGRPDDVRMFYAQSWSVVKYMIDAYGPERMTALVHGIGSGQGFEQALTQTYGMGLEELERRWRDEAIGTTSIVPRPDPGTIGTSIIIAVAIAIAAVVTAYGWRSGKGEPLDP